jgi:hypothetical protein
LHADEADLATDDRGQWARSAAADGMSWPVGAVTAAADSKPLQTLVTFQPYLRH